MFGNLTYYKKLTLDETEIRINLSRVNLKYKESDVLILKKIKKTSE